MSKWYDENEETEITEITDIEDLGRREHFRFSGCLTMILSNDRRTFRTETLNISLGGALLAEHLPVDFHNSKFDVLLIVENREKGRQFLMMTAECLERSTRASGRIRFLKTPESLETQLTAAFAH